MRSHDSLAMAKQVARPRRLHVLVFVGLFASGTVLPAQAVVEIGRDALCDKNCFVVEAVTRIGESSGEGILPGAYTFTRDSRGRFYFAAPTAPGEIFVYNRDGRFIRSVDRRGAGPGEFDRIDWLHASRGDSLYVFDRSNVRLTLLSPSLEVVRMGRFHGTATDAVTLTSGRLVVSARIPTPESVGLPLHLLDSDESVKRSFGSEREFYRSDMVFSIQRRLTPAADDRFWAGHRTAYVLELWDANGTKHQTLQRTVDWFRPYLRTLQTTEQQPPQPSMNSVHLDKNGLLWVIVQIADQDYTRAIERVSTPEGLGTRFLDVHKVYDTVMEVIDPSSGRLVATQRFDADYGAFVADNLAVSLSEDEHGLLYMHLWHVSLSNSEQGAR